jgi:hypothetical protein
MHIAQQLDSSLKMAKIRDLEAYWVILLRKLALFQLKGPQFKNTMILSFSHLQSLRSVTLNETVVKIHIEDTYFFNLRLFVHESYTLWSILNL